MESLPFIWIISRGFIGGAYCNLFWIRSWSGVPLSFIVLVAVQKVFSVFELDCRRFIGVNGVDILWEHAIYNDLILHSWAVIYINWKLYYPTLFDLLLPLGLISSILDLGQGLVASYCTFAIWIYDGWALVFIVSHVKEKSLSILMVLQFFTV